MLESVHNTNDTILQTICENIQLAYPDIDVLEICIKMLPNEQCGVWLQLESVKSDTWLFSMRRCDSYLYLRTIYGPDSRTTISLGDPQLCAKTIEFIHAQLV